MKTNKLMIAALAMGALVFASCNNKPTPDPIIPPVETNDVPDVDKPAEGYVTIVINIPEGTECNGIYMKGTLNGTDWSAENTYIGLEDAAVSAAEAVKFEAIDGSKEWFKATFKLGTAGIEGKICLKFENDNSWQGQAIDVTVDEENTTILLGEINGEGQFSIAADIPAGVLYLNIGGWQHSDCVEVESKTYNVTFLLPTFCSEFEIEAIGGFDGWTGTPVTLEGTTATITITSAVGEGIKIRQKSTWDNQIQVVNVDGEWSDATDYILGEETDVTIDYTAGRWTICAEAE